jgi:hypothetical protein
MLQHPKSTPTKLDNDGPTVLVVEDSRTTSSAIATGSMAASLHADCAPWAFGTSLPHQPRLGRMALWNG